MTNSMRYKTAKERAEAFVNHIDRLGRLYEWSAFEAFEWLGLEAEEEKPLPCIYCKGDMVYFRNANGSFLHCGYCNHQTRGFKNYETVVREYNRVAKKCGEVNDEED